MAVFASAMAFFMDLPIVFCGMGVLVLAGGMAFFLDSLIFVCEMVGVVAFMSKQGEVATGCFIGGS